MIEILNIIIFGNPVTKKNSMQVGKNRYTGKIFVSQSKAYKEYEKEFLKQTLLFYHSSNKTHLKTCPIDRKINLKCIYYMENNKKVDLTNLLNATCDCLVKSGIIKDDNFKIIQSVDGSRVFIDKEHPRVEIYIEEVV